MRGLITSIITVIAITSLQAQPNLEKPKLVVGLTIDQLNTELIEAYWDLYGEHGFKKLWREGLIYKNTSFKMHHTDRSAAVATINTGTYPYIHGIIANSWLDKLTYQPESCVFDQDYMGNYTEFSSSPRNILSSTITDELTKENEGLSLIYSIAPYADMAILAGGHTANNAFWFNTENGKWSSSTYYENYPDWASRYNEQKAVPFREKELIWTPLAPIEKYHKTTNTFKESFRHILLGPSSDSNRYQEVVNSPIINQEVLNFTNELLQQTELGQDHITDFLQLGFNVGNTTIPNKLNSVENQDIYLRTDQNIADLLQLIDNKVGLEHTLFYITSTGYRREIEEEQKRYKLPQGDFFIHRSSALLNLYLIAKYGEGHYIDFYNGLQIYLNHDLIEKKKLKLAEIQQESAQFLLEISGIQNVYYSSDLLLNSLDSNKISVKNSFHKKRSGDLILEIQPGWKVINLYDKVEQIVSYAAIQSPTIFLGRHFEPQIKTTPIDATAIAPSISKSIHIRAPNAAQTPSIY